MSLRIVSSLVILLSALKFYYSKTDGEMIKKSVEFEVFGRVQGVFFRKYTKQQADRLGLRGWCRNTAQGTVIGQLQGTPDDIDVMMNWLKSKGSPTSTIAKAVFRNQHDINDFTFDDFQILRD